MIFSKGLRTNFNSSPFWVNFMKNNILRNSIKLALTGLLTVGAASNASAHVMYNTFNAYASNIGTDGATDTDGWSSDGSWVGTVDGNAPFDSNAPVANWAAHLHSAGGSLVVSSQDAHDDYGVWADIDTARGAWNDGWPTGGLSSSGWSHNTDVGLFKSDVTQKVTFSVSNINPNSWQNFGITVFSGISPSYVHHGGWNEGYIPGANEAPVKISNPLGTTGLTFVAFTDNSTVSFSAEAGQVYTLLLGGYSGLDVYGPFAGYQVDISSVPVPGAVWLFGSAIAGLVGFGKRKREIA
jgi:hypothetical protein